MNNSLPNPSDTQVLYLFQSNLALLPSGKLYFTFSTINSLSNPSGTLALPLLLPNLASLLFAKFLFASPVINIAIVSDSLWITHCFSLRK